MIYVFPPTHLTPYNEVIICTSEDLGGHIKIPHGGTKNTL